MTEHSGPPGLDMWIATSEGGRDHNEDAFRSFAWRDERVIAVLDGMGGSAAGEIASWVASEAIKTTYPEVREEGGDPQEALARSLRAASAAIKAEAAGRPERTGMGCTAVLCSIGPEGTRFAHVGDSRVYLLDADGVLEQATRDHTRVQALVDQGILSAEAARSHPDGHVITRALGRDKDEVDLNGGRLLPLDRTTLVACTDGLTGVVTDEIIQLAAASLNAKHATIALIDLAVQLGTTDNVTVAVVRRGAPQRRMPVTRFYEVASELAGTHLLVSPDLVETDLVGAPHVAAAAGVVGASATSAPLAMAPSATMPSASDTDRMEVPPAPGAAASKPAKKRGRVQPWQMVVAGILLGLGLFLVFQYVSGLDDRDADGSGDGSGDVADEASGDSPGSTHGSPAVVPVRGRVDGGSGDGEQQEEGTGASSGANVAPVVLPSRPDIGSVPEVRTGGGQRPGTTPPETQEPRLEPRGGATHAAGSTDGSAEESGRTDKAEDEPNLPESDGDGVVADDVGATTSPPSQPPRSRIAPPSDQGSGEQQVAPDTAPGAEDTDVVIEVPDQAEAAPTDVQVADPPPPADPEEAPAPDDETGEGEEDEEVGGDSADPATPGEQEGSSDVTAE